MTEWAPKLQGSDLFREGAHRIRLVVVSAGEGLRAGEYVGVLRADDRGSRLSADLYFGADDGGEGIVFPRGAWAVYIAAKEMREREATVELDCEVYRQDAEVAWRKEGAVVAVLSREEQVAGPRLVRGFVREHSGRELGTIELRHVAPHVRRATIVGRSASDCAVPTSNGGDVGWTQVFGGAGWDVKVENGVPAEREAADGVWSYAELHAALAEGHDGAVLDEEWRYVLMCVPQVRSSEGDLVRGVMFDFGAADINRIPREGSAIAARYRFSDANSWGEARGRLLQEVPAAYLRTAAHELGHAMGLSAHTTQTFGIMNTTEVVAKGARPPVRFPDNIDWSFAPEDLVRLRHLPDSWVRPGGDAFAGQALDLSEAGGGRSRVSLSVQPATDAVPLGVPVRLVMTIRNASASRLVMSGDWGIGSGQMLVVVRDAEGRRHVAVFAVGCAENQGSVVVKPGEQSTRRLALLWGSRGPLFRRGGLYRIAVRLLLDGKGGRHGVTAATEVRVRKAIAGPRRKLVNAIFRDKGIWVMTEIGCDHSHAASGTRQRVLADRTLGPHYRAIESGRVKRGRPRPEGK